MNIETVTKLLRPRPGDLFVCRVPDTTSIEGMERLSEQLRGLLAETGSKMIILSDGATFDKLSDEDLQRAGLMRSPE